MIINNVKRIAFIAPKVVKLVDCDPIDTDKLGEHEVVVKNLYSAISAGTEKANFIGERIGTNPIVFPRYSGYSNCAEVVAIGSEVKDLNIGDRVITIWGTHANYHIMKDENLVKVPDEVSSKEAGVLFIATFPMAALRKVRLEIGEDCGIIGLGVLGQFAVMFARAAGAYPVVGVDPNPLRRAEALKNGADFVFDPTSETYYKDLLKVIPLGYKTAIEVTGVGVALNQTLDLMRRFGRVALLGCTRNSDFSIDYYGKVHTPGIELIGAHTLARPEKESYPHYFTNRDELDSILKMVQGKRVNVAQMIGEIVNPSECEKVYDRLINEKDFPPVVEFDWSLLK